VNSVIPHLDYTVYTVYTLHSTSLLMDNVRSWNNVVAPLVSVLTATKAKRLTQIGIFPIPSDPYENL
jgi:hypothetical protein